MICALHQVKFHPSGSFLSLDHILGTHVVYDNTPCAILVHPIRFSTAGTVYAVEAYAHSPPSAAVCYLLRHSDFTIV